MNATHETALEHIDFAHVQAHDAAALLARAAGERPEELRGELRRIRAILAEALATLDDAAPLAEDLYNASP